MPIARTDLDLLMHFARKSAIDTYTSDDVVHAAKPLGPKAPLTCHVCGFTARDERYMALHSRRRDHQAILHLPLHSLHEGVHV